jgi:serine protease
MKHAARLKRGLLALAVLGLTFAAVRARWEPNEAASLVADGPEDAPTGYVLLDFEDDLEPGAQTALIEELRDALLPYPSPEGEAALGTELSDPANLFRLAVPVAEQAEVLAAMADEGALEGVEVERTWRLPDHASQAVVPADPAPRDGERFVPNDPYYHFQWHLDQVRMPQAWLRSRGAGATVAVLDTGIAHRDEGGFHRAPDLAETPFVRGFDFVHNDPFPDDEHGHGTHCAGTVAQSTNNGLGVAGVAPQASLMPLQVLDRSGAGGWGAIAAAIRYAADHGADVISMSLGGGLPSWTVQRAIDHAHRKGVLVVAAAGNSARSRVEYPARHRHVLSVGAVRYDRDLSFYSNYGDGLDIVAPGGDLRVDQNGDGMPDGVVQNTIVNGDPNEFDYLAWQGTSMATPHVAGVAALVYASGVNDPDEVERILTSTAEDLGDEHRFSSGLVQADAALSAAAEGRAVPRTFLLGLLFAFAGLSWRRRGSLGALGVAAALTGALGLLPWDALGLALDGPLSAGLFAGVAGHGPWAALAALSVLPAAGFVVLTHHIRALRPVALGLVLAAGAACLLEAVWPSARFALVPELLVGPWLLLQGALAALLARVLR